MPSTLPPWPSLHRHPASHALQPYPSTRDLEAKAGRRARRAGAQPASAPEPGAAATAVADAEAADGDAGPSDDENADPNAADDPAAPGPGGDAAFADAPDAATSVVVHHEAILRNKRLVLTYL